MRSWTQTIAGKLLMAFTLIVGLTLAGGVLSLTKFSELQTVLQRLIGVSMPAVRTSLNIENSATQVAVGAAQLSGAEDDVALFTLNEKLTGQIQTLWTDLSTLQSILGETQATQELQTLIGGMDGKIGELNRELSDRTGLLQSRGKLLGSVTGKVEALTLLLGDLQGADLAPASTTIAARQVAELSKEVGRLHGLIVGLANATSAAPFAQFKSQIEASRLFIASRLKTIGGQLSPTDPRLRLVIAAVDDLFAQLQGAGGLVAVSERGLRSQAAIQDLRKSLDQSGDGLRERVQQLVAEVGKESTDSTQRSLAEIAKSRIWLVAIATASLVLAGLIVWLLVFRFVVARLNAVSGSMLAIAQGQLSAPIPNIYDDEIGDMSRALITFRDNAREIVSAQQVAEKARAEAEKARAEAEEARAEAEAASKTKSAFLANMSHELRTPLNAIIGYSEMLAEDAADSGDESSVADLQKIQGAGKHLLGLINDILDLSKIEAGRMDVYLEQVFLASLADQVRTIVEPMVSKNGNRLEIHCPADIGSLRTDMTKLKQSLINLLSNAAKFTQQGTVSLRLSRETGEDGTARVLFAVSDSGIGMTEEQMGRLFQAFTQADSSTTRNFGGTGLGLTITRHFCTMLGGTIDVASESGKGSTFTIVLPDQSSPPTAPAGGGLDELRARAAATGAASPSAVTVLVVDDDPAVHDLLAATLGKEGYRVEHARDGHEALEMMRQNRPDIVSLDVMMPKMDGWSLLGAMKSDPALEDIPVIMLTIVDDRNLGYSLGASEFMTKPIDRSKLVALLRKFAPVAGEARVLIVEDDADTREMLKATVEAEGLKSAEARHGRAALEWLDKHPAPALLLLDLMMPEVDGFECLTRIRQRPELAELPIVVLTAKDLTEAERHFLAERTTLVLSKSAQPIGTLGAALAAIAGRGAERSSPQGVENSPFV